MYQRLIDIHMYIIYVQVQSNCLIVLLFSLRPLYVPLHSSEFIIIFTVHHTRRVSSVLILNFFVFLFSIQKYAIRFYNNSFIFKYLSTKINIQASELNLYNRKQNTSLNEISSIALRLWRPNYHHDLYTNL
jgi:hypothetical protein